ncbi:MAG: GNAT family N-acetyltransferase [Paludibacter sp.]|nr:GNAT family N-acetyltransferase [Paludibacter sp.]
MYTIECLKGLPYEFESFLIQKYDSYITTCKYLEVFGKNHDFYYFPIYDDDKLEDLLVFGNDGNMSKCFNSLVAINQNIVSKCVRILFEKFPFVEKIHIALSYTSYNFKKGILCPTSETYILNLPATLDEYFLLLGPTTRKNLKRYKSKFLREFPRANYVEKTGAEIEEWMVSSIIQLNIDRMLYKGIVPGKVQNDINDYYLFSKHYGCITYIEIDGEIVGGDISYLINKNIYGHVIAFNNQYQKYNLGHICILHAIQNSIEKKMSYYNLLTGSNEYKSKLAAKPHVTYSYLIYRDFCLRFFADKYKMKIEQYIVQLRFSKYSKPT